MLKLRILHEYTVKRGYGIEVSSRTNVASVHSEHYDVIDPPNKKKKKNESSPYSATFTKHQGNSENLSYFDEEGSDKLLHEYAQRSTLENEKVKVYSHGSELSVRGFSNIEALADFLYSESEVFRNFIDSGGKDKLTLELRSCQTGDMSIDRRPVALELSDYYKAYPNLTIIAPSTNIRAEPGGKVFLKNNGVWNVFNQGKYKGTAKTKM